MARRRRRASSPQAMAANDTSLPLANPADEDYAEDMSASEGRGYEDDAAEDAQEEKKEPLSEQEFAGRVRMAVASAERFVDDHITPARVEAAKFYRGASFGDEEEGRSQVVLSEVRDTIQAMMPSLMRIFTSGQKIVEYMPRTADDVNVAEQASDAVNFIFNEMNPGFRYCIRRLRMRCSNALAL
jgi:hypothetical protein